MKRQGINVKDADYTEEIIIRDFIFKVINIELCKNNSCAQISRLVNQCRAD